MGADLGSPVSESCVLYWITLPLVRWRRRNSGLGFLPAFLWEKGKSCVTTCSNSLHLGCDEVEKATGTQLSCQHLGEAGVRKPRDG